MLEYLRQLAARIMSRYGPFNDLPFDPYSSVRVPRSRPPGGRSSAVAVEEPNPPSHVTAAARRAD